MHHVGTLRVATIQTLRGDGRIVEAIHYTWAGVQPHPKGASKLHHR